jgi:hypothetical protein
MIVILILPIVISNYILVTLKETTIWEPSGQGTRRDFKIVLENKTCTIAFSARLERAMHTDRLHCTLDFLPVTPITLIIQHETSREHECVAM